MYWAFGWGLHPTRAEVRFTCSPDHHVLAEASSVNAEPHANAQMIEPDSYRAHCEGCDRSLTYILWHGRRAEQFSLTKQSFSPTL